MNNTEVLAIREFRRFVNCYIYPHTIQYFIENIKYYCEAQEIEFEINPQLIIKFNTNQKEPNNTTIIHNILKDIFIEYFKNETHVKLIRNKIFTEIKDKKCVELLHNALSEIQSGNPNFLGLLFNITALQNNIIYLYL